MESRIGSGSIMGSAPLMLLGAEIKRRRISEVSAVLHVIWAHCAFGGVRSKMHVNVTFPAIVRHDLLYSRLSSPSIYSLDLEATCYIPIVGWGRY